MIGRRLILGLAAALAVPRAARAQPPTVRKRVAVLMSTAEGEAHEQSAVAAFIQSLEKAGWASGRNVEIIYRWGNGDGDRMAANARDIVALMPDAIVAMGANVPSVAQLTSAIPIVFVVLSDIAAERYVGSLAHPGGNLTGFTSGERDLVGKRLQLLREIDPAMRRALYLRSARGGAAGALYRDLAKDAAVSGFAVVDAPAPQASDIEPLIAAFAGKQRSGLLVAFDAFTTAHRAAIIALAARYRLPSLSVSLLYR